MDASISLDPLIAEAKQRMRRRRFVFALLAFLAVAVALVLALRPSGGPPAVRSASNADSARQPAHLTVPLNAYERQWRNWIKHYVSRSDEIRPSTAAIAHELRPAVAASHSVIVRLNVWPATAPPSVELVLATNVAPAVYLKHDLGPLLRAVHSEWRFVEVVDRQGAVIFQNGYRRRNGHFEGMVGVPPALRACSPVPDWGPIGPPCPVK